MIHTTSADKNNISVEIMGTPSETLFELVYTIAGVKNKCLIEKLEMKEDDANRLMTKLFFEAMTMDDSGKVVDKDET